MFGSQYFGFKIAFGNGKNLWYEFLLIDISIDYEYMIELLILGDPIARLPLNLTVRSEDDAYLQCPVAGYPVIRTVWQKDMVSIPSHSRHILFDNGTLFIRSTQDTIDSGLYVCTKINERGQSATGNLHLRIMSKY